MTTAITRKTLLEAPIDPAREIAQVQIQQVTLGPGQRAPLHSHPCPTLGVVTEGAIVFQIVGKQATHLKAGDAFYEPADVWVAHFDNEGTGPATFVVHYMLAPGEHETVQVHATTRNVE